MDRVKDLVCGMMIDPKTAAARLEYDGQVYYFCAPGCKVAFEKDPDKYVNREHVAAELGHCCCRLASQGRHRMGSASAIIVAVNALLLR